MGVKENRMSDIEFPLLYEDFCTGINPFIVGQKKIILIVN